MKHSPGFLALVDDARRRIRECGIDDVRARLDRGERFHLVDVREDDEFAVDRVAGARHIGRGVLERDVETLIPGKDAPIVLYCGGGYPLGAGGGQPAEDGVHQRRVDGRRHPRLARGQLRRSKRGSEPSPAVRAAIVACDDCPRLRRYCARIAREKKAAHRDDTYWGRPVPGFGDPDARLLLVGLAPAAHGANRTGRVFTGDGSGDFLAAALHAAGLREHRRPRAAPTTA